MSELAMSGLADDASLVRSSGSYDVPWNAAQRVTFRFFLSYDFMTVPRSRPG